MEKIKYISCINHTILFFCSKVSQIKFYTLLNNEDSFFPRNDSGANGHVYCHSAVSIEYYIN